MPDLTTIETLTAQIRDRYPEMLIDLRGRRSGAGWMGYACVGQRRDGECPVSQDHGATKAAAIEAALRSAHWYWLQGKDVV